MTFELEMEIGGLLGLVATNRVLDTFIDELFAETLYRLYARGQALAADFGAEPALPSEDVILRIYQNEQGLELWHKGRTYRLEPGE